MKLLNLQTLSALFFSQDQALAAAHSAPHPSTLAHEVSSSSSLDDWLAAGSQTALRNVVANIGANGEKVKGAHAGIVVASPSKSDPDYFYTWTRDAAMVMKLIVDEFIAGNDDLQPLVHEYISAQAKVQVINNPSGSLESGGLGEPKYDVDETAFTGAWGRPQRDGPALRAITLATYAEWLIDHGYPSLAESIVWPIMRNDLSYVGQYWNASGFDLWEEIQGASFFTTAAQYRALVQGRAVAEALGKTCEPCTSQASQVLCLLQSFWTGSYINSNPSSGRSGKDANSILGSIGLFDASASECEDETFQPCSSRALANLKAVVDAFRDIYAVNHGIPSSQRVVIGRYPEDVYYGGNPWYLTTYAAAEQLYDAAYQWQQIGKIVIDEVSKGFFESIRVSSDVGSYALGSAEFNATVEAVLQYADGFFDATRHYTPDSFSLSEQLSKTDGSQLSAADLTWSYAAFVTAANRRKSIVPGSWRQSSTQDVPSVCHAAAPVAGVYATPTNTKWPTPFPQPSQSWTPSPDPTASPPCTAVNVRFNEVATTRPGQDIYIAGSVPELGLWNTDNAVRLSADLYSVNNHLWYIDVKLPAGQSVEYKYVRKEGGSVTWESGSNRVLKVPDSCDHSVSTGDSWR